jgi:hypothetical protein
MKLSELHRIVNLTHRPDHYVDPDVTIAISMPYATIGAHPMVNVKSASLGFDWENGKFMIWPEEKLQHFDVDFAAQMSKMQKELGASEYERRGLQAEVKRLRKLLKESE